MGLDLTSLLAGLVMIGFLVVIHEAGHFAFAKLFGVGVPVFSIGMGPRLFGVVWRGTDYRISALPIGGYVMMAGADPYGEEDVHASVDPDEDFMKKPVWQRFIVMLAGPAVNILLPFVMFTILLMAGEPRLAPVVGTVLPDTPAAAAGFQSDDRVVAVDGESVDIWEDVVDALVARAAGSSDVRLTVTRGAEDTPTQAEVVLPASAIGLTPDGVLDVNNLGLGAFRMTPRIGVDDAASPAARAGLLTGDFVVAVDEVEITDWPGLQSALADGAPHTLGVARFENDEAREPKRFDLELPALDRSASSWQPPAEVLWVDAYGMAPAQLFAKAVSEDSAAAEAGVQVGDRFVSVDGTPVRTFSHFIQLVGATVQDRDQPRALELRLRRDGSPLTLTMTPRVQVVDGEAYARPLVGVERFSQTTTGVGSAIKHHTFFEAVPRATQEASALLGQTFAILGNMFTGRADPAKNVGGPVAMFAVAGMVAESGLFAFARLAGMFSISVGVINLLPVPVLDGGQILFYLAEAVRGRPLSLELRERLQMVGVLALGGLMVLITINDFTRWWGAS